MKEEKTYWKKCLWANLVCYLPQNIDNVILLEQISRIILEISDRFGQMCHKWFIP